MSEQSTRITPRKLLALAVLVSLHASSCALAMKAAVGVGAWDAMAQTISLITHIKVGSIGFCANSLCVACELLLMKKSFGIRQILQIPVAMLLGTVINLVLYNVLTFDLNAYAARLVTLTLTQMACGFFVGGLMALDVVTFPLEGLCRVASERYGWNFGRIRQLVDVGSIAISVGLSLLFGIGLTVREGTLISMLVFAPIMSRSMGLWRRLFTKLGVL